MALIFGSGKIHGVRHDYGYQEGWHWPRRSINDPRSHNVDDYTRVTGFFQVHWALYINDPGSIKLHVNSPEKAMDAALNDIKRHVVAQLLSHSIEVIVRNNGYV